MFKLKSWIILKLVGKTKVMMNWDIEFHKEFCMSNLGGDVLISLPKNNMIVTGNSCHFGLTDHIS
jgi:hypothetical protein